MTNRNPAQRNGDLLETLEHRQHFAATVNVSVFEPFALRDSRQQGVFVVTRRDNLQSDLTVSLVVRGTARNSLDYGRIGTEVTIPAGQRSVAVPVRPVNNTLKSEYVTLTADIPTGYRTSSATGVVYVVSNAQSPVPLVRAADFFLPVTAGLSPRTGAMVPVTRPTPPTGGSTIVPDDSVISNGSGGITTIPTGSTTGIGGAVTPGTVQTVTIDPVTGLPTVVTETIGGSGVGLPDGTSGTGTGTVTVTTFDPITGRPITTTTSTGTIASSIFGTTPIVM